MKTSKRKLGDLGEELACGFLTSRGQTILERNWRTGHLEVDVISADGAGLHFVEVKSRTAPVSADPLSAVTLQKMKRMSAAALSYVRGRRMSGTEMFFDLINVVFNGGQADIKYYPQAFLPNIY